MDSILTSQQRAWLRKQAHHLQPVVSIGVAGMTPAVEKATDEALSHHEMIKVKFHGLKDEKREVCDYLAKTLKAEVVGIIGNIGILYRATKDPEKRQYRVPAIG